MPSFLTRQLKTSEPRFRKLTRTQTPEIQMQHTEYRNFPKVNRGNAFDNSKENLSYEHHLAKVRSACKLDEQTMVSSYLNTIRKDYDDMSKVSRRELMSMKMKKRQIQFIREKTHIFKEKRQELELNIEQKEKQTAQIRNKYEDAKMQTKTLENIIIRMKKDEIFYKQYGRIRDQQLKKKMKEVKTRDEALIHEEEKIQHLMITYNECKSLYHKNQELREKKFQDYCGKISNVKQRERFIQERKERTYELQSIQLNDTLDEKNIHMREITLAHKVADSLLESKVTSLIKKYSSVQNAFYLVKIKTGVSEPQLLTNKFFSYQETSESLLQNIGLLEKKVEELQTKKNMLSATYKDIISDHFSIADYRHSNGSSIAKFQKEDIIKQINQKRLLVNQIESWIQKRLQYVSQQEGEKGQSIESKFQLLCNTTKQGIKQYEHAYASDKKVQIMGVRMKKIVKEITAQELSMRLKENEEMNETNLVEDEFIKTSRQNLMKKNFMIKRQKRESGSIFSK